MQDFFYGGGARLIKVIKSGCGPHKGVGAGGGYAPSRAKLLILSKY